MQSKCSNVTVMMVLICICKYVTKERNADLGEYNTGLY